MYYSKDQKSKDQNQTQKFDDAKILRHIHLFGKIFIK